MKKFEKRYEIILAMQLSEIKKEQMLADLMTDLEKDFRPTGSENEAVEYGKCEKYALYRRIANSFR